ncbi:hypothetical protein [Halomonas binhaiensis]|uniref:Uncharacterized protein n=1 Tax=Halomonas binhaiensis TaxID=2562282 RepID=A0A5C1NEM0_9GAMM|nr:hypothetical protein [Halomonas binhaiensis]QEM80918.1 hypothetical protein E4T21_04650 [Halomonas binhaiensis]
MTESTLRTLSTEELDAVVGGGFLSDVVGLLPVDATQAQNYLDVYGGQVIQMLSNLAPNPLNRIAEGVGELLF